MRTNVNPRALHERLREALVYLEFEDARLLTPFDMEPVEYSALQILDTTRGLRMGDLRERLLVDKSKVTRIVDHLEARGWVRREPDPDDRRAARVVLTPAGQTHRRQADIARDAALPGRFAALNATEQTTLGQLLDTLRDHLVERLATNSSNEELS